MPGEARLVRNGPGMFFRTGIFSVFAVTLFLIFSSGCVHQTKANHQASVHKKSHEVMPFDMSKTLHIFEMTESGGIQQVIAKDTNDSEQILIIQQHLQHEAMLFKNGNFSDPASLHGSDMPGIKELAAGAANMSVEYTALPNGGQIAFLTRDVHLLTAIHRWFGAQLSDHGPDATYR